MISPTALSLLAFMPHDASDVLLDDPPSLNVKHAIASGLKGVGYRPTLTVEDAIASGLNRAGYSPGKHAGGDDSSPPAPAYSGPISSTAPSYLNADLASHYGMDAATAYQEALANTAHQREVADLKSAGLNPVLSARYGGASGVSGAQLLSSGSSSGSSRSSSETDDVSSLIGGMVSLFTGSSARGNAAEKIFHSVQNIFSSSSAKDLFSRV